MSCTKVWFSTFINVWKHLHYSTPKSFMLFMSYLTLMNLLPDNYFQQAVWLVRDRVSSSDLVPIQKQQCCMHTQLNISMPAKAVYKKMSPQ